MKRKVEAKQDETEFARFDEFVSKLVKVPKKEINEREKVEKQKKETDGKR
jgi:hypothetical protein